MSKKTWQELLVYSAAMFIFSFAVISTETIIFHVLLIVRDYLQATFIITIAMFGIAAGGIVSFYLLKINIKYILAFAAICFLASIPFAYYYIINIDSFSYPYPLVFPFFFSSIAISSIFSKGNSNKVYFINLVASATGVLYPIYFVSTFKSENSLIIIMFFPVIFIATLAFIYKHLITRILLGIISISGIITIFILLSYNLKIPREISINDFENKILPAVKDEISLEFIKDVYKKDESKNKYILKTDKYSEKRARYVLNDIGYMKTIDINFNINNKDPEKVRFKLYDVMFAKNKLVLSEDSLLGRVELLTSTDSKKRFLMAQNSWLLDEIDPHNGTIRDPRVPHINNADIFIVGLSADGIVKSAKRLPGAKVSGVEINPIIYRLMTEKGHFAEKANYPYRDVEVYKAEGRSFLESSDKKYDMITMMNIHSEFGPSCTLAPEYFHTIEAVKLLLSRLTDRGMAVYEEIIYTKRASYSFYKFINTITKAMQQIGIDNPLKHLIVYKWDFWEGGSAFRTVVFKPTPFTPKEKSRFMKYMELIEERYGAKLLIFTDQKRNNSLYKNISITGAPYYLNEEYPRWIHENAFTKQILSPLNNSDRDFVKSLYRYNKNNKFYYYKKKNSEQDKQKFLVILDKTDFCYKLNLSPTTDDKPFPYNIYVIKKEILKLMRIVGFMALILFIPILILIIYRYSTHKLRLFTHFSFFGIMGFGYMLVEIVLMQYYQRFIGYPIYALIVTLGGLLLFSGIGSFVSHTFSKKTLLICISFIPVILILKLFFLDSVFVAFAKYSFNAKLFISAGLLFPLTFLMGFPFPHALEQIKSDISNEYGTLMFGVSGAFSTIAATTSILISITYGFTWTFSVGIIAYVLGIGLFAIVKK